MAFRKYTQCETVGNFTAVDYAQKLLFTDIGLLRKLFATIVLLAIGSVLLPAALVVALLTIIAYCNWWLYKRLICLGGEKDKCAIGLLVSVEPPADKTGFDSLDTDYSINLLLAPHGIGGGQAEIENDGIQGDLIREQSTTGDARVAGIIKEFPFKGITVKAGDDSAAVVYQQAVLHCEFEGGGVKKMKDAAEAALPFALLAAAACSIPFPLFALVCLILAAIATVITIAGLGSALKDRGTPTDVNPKLDDLHRHEDILFVKGEWVFDSAHDGWNEIHPIKTCLRIGSWRGTWDSADEWADHFDDWSKSSQPPDLPTPTTPLPPALPTAFLTIDPNNLVGGKPAKGTIVFGAPLAAGGTLLLTSSDPAVVVPPSVTVVKNETLHRFDVTTKAVSTRLKVEIAATFGGATQTVAVIVRPVPTPEDWKKLIQSWCDMVSDATSSLTVANQNQPENQWTVHPLIDGCQPQEPPPPPPSPPPIH
jgi:hypothetical protein